MVDVPGLGLPLSLVLLLAGTGLIVAEALAPGAHFIVIGVALLVAGLVGVLLPPGLGALSVFILAAVVLLAGAVSLYAYREFDFYGGRGSGQTSDSEALRGKSGRVTERVTTSEGEVKLEEGGFNPYYRARTTSGSIEVGEEVIVVDPGGGNVVTVESLHSGEDPIDRELARERRRTERERAADEDRESNTESGTETA
ncbi:NfeD family protein [Salinirubellus salinus]|jgi:membrane protein implicated in regulation of membrane protease activity|uniref:NfeD family protein n=1 Tax=Salinirubellus salinus TaxID=1364945 RepID=A0A9E7R394_9EURY|nr:NfeD family protein [Salinirubellus salinus]UWM54929.1 NfeD family protein [Salinirubellus salinus]